MKNVKIKFLLAIFIAAFIVAFTRCKNSDGEEQKNPDFQKPQVLEGGLKIQLNPTSPAYNIIKTVQANQGTAKISVKLPARIVATITSAIIGDEKIILFDSQDVTSLYTLFQQSKANLQKSTNNLKRMKDMFENKMATSKDLSDVENEASIAKTSMLELEVRLRSLGFNPIDLEKAPANTAWLIADVSESQINEVQKGESVDLVFTSFPDKIFVGRADAIGDIVDPSTRSIRVRVTVPNNNKLMPGMFGMADFGNLVNSVVTLPTSSIVTVEGKDYTFVEITPGVFVRREVFVGRSNESQVIVLRGIQSGEKVVTDGTILLKGMSFGY